MVLMLLITFVSYVLLLFSSETCSSIGLHTTTISTRESAPSLGLTLNIGLAEVD